MGLTLSYKRDIVNIIIAIDDEYAGSLVTAITGIFGTLFMSRGYAAVANWR